MTPEEMTQLAVLTRKYAGELNGKTRAKKLTKKRRQEIARQAAQARWSKDRKSA